MSEVRTPLPPETCSECGKTLSRRVLAHVWDGQRIVCTTCRRKFEAARHAAEPPPPASASQVRFARELGLTFPDNANAKEMDALITAAVNPPASAELLVKARSLGLDPPDGIRTKRLEEDICEAEWDAENRRQIVRWVYSVFRQMAGAKWILPSDVPAPAVVFNEIANEIWADEKLRDVVLDIDVGTAPHWFDNAVDDRGIEPCSADEHWYFFGRDGPSTRTKAYTRTVAMIEQRIRIVRE